METCEAIREMMEHGATTALEVSRRIGRSDNYISSMLSRGSVPSAQTLATIAEACGWHLCLVSEEETVRIDGRKLSVTNQIGIDAPQDSVR